MACVVVTSTGVIAVDEQPVQLAGTQATQFPPAYYTQHLVDGVRLPVKACTLPDYEHAAA